MKSLVSMIALIALIAPACSPSSETAENAQKVEESTPAVTQEKGQANLEAATSTTPRAAKNEKTLKLYHDADWANHTESAQAIWYGFETALAEVNHTVQDYRLELVKKNHSGNVTRSLSNFEAFIEDDQALAVISGIHSPPLIKNRDFINENDVLTLVPWAAGGPITRYPSSENWIFRLSLDDTKVGSALIDYAVDEKACKAPHLLLEDSLWGDSNAKNMGVALAERQGQSSSLSRFNWNLETHVARSKLQDLKQQGADCVILVSNAIEGSKIAIAMSELDEDNRLPIISHWGITGGNFHEIVTADIRKKIDLSFIQSCFSFNQETLSPIGQNVLERAKKRYPEHIKTSTDIKSPVGFIHGYDLAQLLLSAMNNVALTDDVMQNRHAIRLALENLQEPVEGLVKTYTVPFSAYSAANPDAHEALGKNDFCMASYGPVDEILVSSKKM